MNNLNFSNGYKTFTINGDENAVISVNTCDYGIFERAEKSAEIFENLKSDLSDKNSIETVSMLDKKVREQINYIFGTDVCSAAFGKANCISFVDGIPMFIRFLNAIMPVISAEIEKSNKAASEKMNDFIKRIK